MNVETLRVFCEVARLRSFSRAASELRLTQSAASQAVQSLEKEIGLQLIDRSRRPANLTPPGERFYVSCREILDRLSLAIAEIRELGDEVAGPVHVASIYSVGLYHTNKIRHFMEAYPKANVRLRYLRPNLVTAAVLQGEANLGLTSYPKETRELAVVAWQEEDMVLVCPADHRLAQASSTRFEDLAGENFVAFDDDLVIRDRVDAALHRHKTEVSVVMEFDNIETMKQAIQVRAGVSILPEATVREEVAAGTLVAVPFESGALHRPIGIIYRKGKPLSLAARKFIDVLVGREA